MERGAVVQVARGLPPFLGGPSVSGNRSNRKVTRRPGGDPEVSHRGRGPDVAQPCSPGVPRPCTSPCRGFPAGSDSALSRPLSPRGRSQVLRALRGARRWLQPGSSLSARSPGPSKDRAPGPGKWRGLNHPGTSGARPGTRESCGGRRDARWKVARGVRRGGARSRAGSPPSCLRAAFGHLGPLRTAGCAASSRGSKTRQAALGELSPARRAAQASQRRWGAAVAGQVPPGCPLPWPRGRRCGRARSPGWTQQAGTGGGCSRAGIGSAGRARPRSETPVPLLAAALWSSRWLNQNRFPGSVRRVSRGRLSVQPQALLSTQHCSMVDRLTQR